MSCMSSSPVGDSAGRSRTCRTSCRSCSAGRSTWCRGRRCTSVYVRRYWRRLSPCMRRDVLLLEEMIQAAVQAVALVEGVAVEDLAADRIRRDALLWNFTVPGEAAAQLSDELKQDFASVARRQPARLRNRIVHGYWSIDLDVVHATALERPPGFIDDLRRVLSAVAAQDDEGPS